jgi:flagellar hook assembly protein FlgD
MYYSTRLLSFHTAEGRMNMRVWKIVSTAVLADRAMDAGVHDAVWNGRSDSGETLGSGLYLYRLEAGAFRGQGKMMLLR